MIKKFLVATCLTLLLVVGAQAKIEPKPGQAEENFVQLKKLSETSGKAKKLISDDFIEEGSGGDDDEYNYDDEDDYYDDYSEGSGDDAVLSVHSDEELAKLIPDVKKKNQASNDVKDDIHFDEDTNQVTGGDDDDDDAEYDEHMYEYNNDDDYDEDYNFDEDYDEDDVDDDDEDDDDDDDDEDTVSTSYEIEVEPEVKTGFNLFQPSYIFLMLASALISFAFFTLAFILCRRSLLERRKKTMVPFVVSGPTMHHHSASSIPSKSYSNSTPIVKNYQRVPTSTMEYLQQQQQQHTAVDINETNKPLLYKT